MLARLYKGTVMLTTLADFDRVPRILRLNIAGQPVEWVAWQDAVCLYARDLVVWTVGDPLVTIRGGRSKDTGEMSAQEKFTASSPVMGAWSLATLKFRRSLTLLCLSVMAIRVCTVQSS